MITKLKLLISLIVVLVCFYIIEVQQVSANISIAYPQEGIYVLRPQCALEYCLSVENASRSNGSNVVISKNQRWRIERLASSRYYKISAENSGLVLDVDHGNAFDGNNVLVWQYHGGTNQQFIFLDCGDGYYIIQANVNGNYVLDVDHGNAFDGNNVLIWQYHGGPNQKWKLVRVGD